MTKYILAIMIMCMLIGNAQSIELEILLPCKAAAIRYCDKSKGLDQCGDKLAEKKDHITTSCREVLQRFGKL